MQEFCFLGYFPESGGFSTFAGVLDTGKLANRACSSRILTHDSAREIQRLLQILQDCSLNECTPRKYQICQIIQFLTCRCERLLRICIVQIRPWRHALDHAYLHGSHAAPLSYIIQIIQIVNISALTDPDQVGIDHRSKLCQYVNTQRYFNTPFAFKSVSGAPHPKKRKNDSFTRGAGPTCLAIACCFCCLKAASYRRKKFYTSVMIQIIEITQFFTCRCERLCRICIVQTQPRKHVLQQITQIVWVPSGNMIQII